jgi:hypothetical protein
LRVSRKDHLLHLSGAVGHLLGCPRSGLKAEPPGSDPQLNDEFFTNPRTITPVVAYGSMKIKLW